MTSSEIPHGIPYNHWYSVEFSRDLVSAPKQNKGFELDWRQRTWGMRQAKERYCSAHSSWRHWLGQCESSMLDHTAGGSQDCVTCLQRGRWQV